MGAHHLLGVEQVGQPGAGGVAAEQLGEQVGVERQGGGPALGQRGVPLVQELRDVPEQQRARERRRLLGGDLDDPDLAGLQRPQHALEARHVEDVLQALAHGLEHDREGRVAGGHLQQGRGALALLPQRLAPVGPAPGQQQRPRRALTEPGREQGRPAELVGDALLHRARVEQQRLEHLRRRSVVRGVGVDRGRVLGRLPRAGVEVGHPQHDAVVGRHRLDVEAVQVAHRRRHRQRPRPVHLGTEGGVDHDPPVAELVAEPLDHDRRVVGDVPGGLALLAQVPDQVVRRPRVEPAGGQPGARLLVGHRVELADELPDRAAELERSPDLVAVPEREPAGLAGRGGHEHLVVGDVLDPPRGGTEGEHVAHPRLVDHLLVELADAAPALLRAAGRLLGAGGEEHPVEAAVGDGAAAGDREPLRPRPPGQRARDPVPHHPRAQLGELLAGVAAGEHVEHRLQDRTAEGAEGRRAPDQGVQLVDVPVVQGGHGHDVLGEHVERVGRHPQRLDLGGAHPLGDDRHRDQVGAELREHHAAADGTDLVPRAADALQTAGDARRRLDLDHEVDRAHVDAELEGRRGHHGGQPAGLQVVLDQRPLLLGDRAVVGASQHGGRTLRRPGLRHHLGGRARRAVGGLVAVGLERRQPGGPGLVQPCREPLGQPAGVGEDEGRPGRLPLDGGDEVDHALLDVRPDRLRGRRSRGVARQVGGAVVGGGGLPELGHVLDRDHHGQVPLLLRRRLHHGDGPAAVGTGLALAGQEPRDLLDRTHGGREPDALRRLLQQRVEPLERQRQVRAALGPRDGVHLVDDHGLDAGELLARPGGEDEEERLRGGDEDVGRPGGEGPALGGGGVAGAHRHAQRPDGLAHPRTGLGQSGQRRPQVALDVARQGLERRDVQDAAAVPGVLGRLGGRQPVDRPQERRQRLAGTGGGDHEGVVPRADRVPRPGLRGGRRRERGGEPLAGRCAEPGQDLGRRALVDHPRIVSPVPDNRPGARGAGG